VLYGAVGYSHEFSRDFLGIHYRPGEIFNYRFGVGFAVNDRITLSTALINLIQGTWSAAGESLPASSQEPMTIRLAMTVSASRRFIVEPFVTFGLNDDAPEADLGVILTRRFH
jgi:hypothetical protein